MTSLKWKIFRVANLVQFLYSLALFLFIIANSIKNGLPDSFFILFPIGFLVMSCNNYINLYILRKYFPRKLLDFDLKSINTILFVLCILFGLLLVVVIIIGSTEEFKRENLHEYPGKLALAGLVLVLSNWIYILIMQVKMTKVVKKESYNALTDTINSIGRE